VNGWPLAERLAVWFVTGSVFAWSCWSIYVRHFRRQGEK
jgi:hypothetical protein